MKTSMIFYIVFSAVVLGGYAAASLSGWDIGGSASPPRQLPPNMAAGDRSPTGGGVFWYGGFTGGK